MKGQTEAEMISHIKYAGTWGVISTAIVFVMAVIGCLPWISNTQKASRRARMVYLKNYLAMRKTVGMHSSSDTLLSAISDDSVVRSVLFSVENAS